MPSVVTTHESVTTPASKILQYIETADSWPLRDERGTLIRRIERDEFRLIAQSGRDDVVFAVGTATRIKFLKLSVPEVDFHAAIAESPRAAPRCCADPRSPAPGGSV